ncbi:MAG: tetratricopeptide repeat protein [Candidatus Eutrophobiaceae bacterium]
MPTTISRSICFCLALSIVLCAPCLRAADDFNSGVIAYTKGDYDKAFNAMHALAEISNNGLAQHYLGMMYMNGQGVKQDYKEAAQWFRKAAENRIASSQYKLANLYMSGRGLPFDHEAAYAWLLTGSAHGHALSEKTLKKAKSKLSLEELAEAKKLSEELIAKYGPKPEPDPSQPTQSKN